MLLMRLGNTQVTWHKNEFATSVKNNSSNLLIFNRSIVTEWNFMRFHFIDLVARFYIDKDDI